jgi:hypothetical protein
MLTVTLINKYNLNKCITMFYGTRDGECNSVPPTMFYAERSSPFNLHAVGAYMWSTRRAYTHSELLIDFPQYKWWHWRICRQHTLHKILRKEEEILLKRWFLRGITYLLINSMQFLHCFTRKGICVLLIWSTFSCECFWLSCLFCQTRKNYLQRKKKGLWVFLVYSSIFPSFHFWPVFGPCYLTYMREYLLNVSAIPDIHPGLLKCVTLLRHSTYMSFHNIVGI